MPLQARREKEKYSDIKVGFDLHPVKKDLALDKGDKAVIRSLKNLMFTDRYERPWDPKIGSGLKAYLFENVNSLTASNIRTRIIDVVLKYEPRVVLIDVRVEVLPDDNKYNVWITFALVNDPTPIVFNQILQRTR